MKKKNIAKLETQITEGDFKSVGVFKDRKQVAEVTQLRPEDHLDSESIYLNADPNTKKLAVHKNKKTALSHIINEDVRKALKRGFSHRTSYEVPQLPRPKRASVKPNVARLGPMRKVKVGNKTGYTRKRR